MRQTPQQAIDDFIIQYLKVFLKQEGFVKYGRTWAKVGANFSFILSIQADKWNSADSIPQCFVNYGVFVPSLYESVFRMPVPKRPMEYDCILRKRLLNKNGEEFWKVYPGKRKPLFGTKYNNTAEEIIEAIKTQSFKLFHEIESIDDVRKRLR